MSKGIVIVLVCAMVSPVVAAGAARRPTPQAQKPVARADAPATQDPSEKLREDWDMADLQLTREAVDDASYPPDIRQSAIDAIDLFLGQQEKLVTGAAAKPANLPQAQKQRAALEAQFQKKMAIIYKNPKFKAELDKRLAAMDKEMDDMADGANKLFADLDAAGVTAQQKADLKPVIAEASREMKEVKQKSATRSVRDRKVREAAVARLRKAKAAIRRRLTAAQRQKLQQKQLENK